MSNWIGGAYVKRCANETNGTNLFRFHRISHHDLRIVAHNDDLLGSIWCGRKSPYAFSGNRRVDYRNGVVCRLWDLVGV